MKYIIIIDDTESGVSIMADKTQSLDEVLGGITSTNALELGEFLTTAANVWIETKEMPLQEALTYVQSITTKPTTTKSTLN